MSRAESREAPHPSDPWLLVLVAAGFAARAVTALLLDTGSTLVNDEGTYAAAAAKLVTSGQLDTGDFVRPPLYFLFVGFFQLLVGPQWRPLLELSQCAIGAATAWPIHAMARGLGGLRCARVAAAFWLFDPTLVAYAHLVWPETLFALLAAWAFAGVRDAERAPPWKLARLGVVCGLAMLLKPVFGLFSVVLASWWWQRLGFARAVRLSLVYAVAAAVTILPWVARNQLRYGPAVVLENQGPYNLWVGNDPRPSSWILAEWSALPDPVTRSRVGVERGLGAIAQDPGRFLARSAVRAVNVWGLEFFVLRNAVLGAYGDVSREALLTAFWTLQLGWLLMLLAGAAGLPRSWSVPALRPPLLYGLAVTLLVASMVGSTRFRVPLAVPLCVAAGAGAPLLLRARLRRPEILAVAVAVGLLLVSASRPLFRTLIAARFESTTELARDDWMSHRY